MLTLMQTHARQQQCLMGIGLWLVLVGSSRLCQAGEVVVTSRITYQVPDGVYVNAGTDKGLQQGLVGTVHLDDGHLFPFEVLHSARNTALLRVDGLDTTRRNLRDQSIELAFESAKQTETSSTPKTSPPSDSDPSSPAPGEDEAFVPLLTPVKRAPNLPRHENISHGRVQVRHAFQSDSDNQLDYAITRVNSSGSIERLQGSPWSFDWSGNIKYRSGDAYRNHSDYESLRPDIYRAVFQHPLEEGGFLRFGRFLPRELPGIGYLDGVQSEIRSSGPWRIGAVAGFKPDRVDLGASAEEPTVAGYATVEAGQRNKNYYSGTVGLLSSLFDGQANRLALLVDQRARLGTRLNLYSTAEIDFGVADTSTSSSVQLTRLNLIASSKISRSFTLRAGLDHWQRPDTLDQRDLLSIQDDRLFDNGYWRYWVGAQHKLPWSLRLSEQVSFIDSDAGNNASRWRVGLTRTGVLAWNSASLTATLYNLQARGADGYGSRISAYLPWWQGKLVVRPAVGLRWLDTVAQADDLTLTYYSVHVDSRVSATWTLFGGLTTSSGDGADATLFDLGARYKW
jgi:hypothetical protein